MFKDTNHNISDMDNKVAFAVELISTINPDRKTTIPVPPDFQRPLSPMWKRARVFTKPKNPVPMQQL